MFRVSCLVKTLKAVARAALSFPAGAPPTGTDEVFVPSNGVITLNLNRLPAKKKTEGLQYQQVPNEPREKAVFRV